MSQSSTNNSGGPQDASKDRKGVVNRPRLRPNGPKAFSGTSGTEGASEGGDAAPPGTTSLVGEANGPMVVDEPAVAPAGQGPHGSETTSMSATGKDSEHELGKRMRDLDREDIAESENEPDDGSDDGQSGQRRHSAGAEGSDGDGGRGGGSSVGSRRRDPAKGK